MEDLSKYQTPVPHLDHGGITQRRGSRPPPEPVSSYDPYGRSDHMSAYQQPSQPLQPPPQPNFMPQNTFTPAPVSAPQPPMNIFTPDFSQSYGQPPSASGVPPPVVNAGKVLKIVVFHANIHNYQPFQP